MGAVDEGVRQLRVRTDPYPVATLPAGDYLVGDPSYAFPSTRLWEAWIGRAESEEGEGLLAAETDGHAVAACALVSGIGDVTDQDGFDYVEDSGLIGAVPVQLVDQSEDIDELRRVFFAQDFEVYVSGPIIHVGHLRIDAAEDYDDEEDEMEDLGGPGAHVKLYELRADRSESDMSVVPRLKVYRRELGLDRDELDDRIAEGRFGDGLVAPIRCRVARTGNAGDLLWTKGSALTIASRRMVAALEEAGTTGFSTFEIEVAGGDLGERYVGLVAHRVLGGSDVFAPYRSVRTSSIMVNQRAMDALESAGCNDFRVVPVG